jgi:hypothetical protein
MLSLMGRRELLRDSLLFAYTGDRWNVLQVYDAIGQIPPKNDG